MNCNKVLSLVTFWMLCMSLSAQYYTVKGGSGTPYMIEDKPNKLKVYVVNGVENVEISYSDPSSSAHQWYKYKTKALEAEKISSSQAGTTSTISHVEDGCGYFVYKEGVLTEYVWIIDYAQHPFNVQSIEVESAKNECSGAVRVKANPSVDELYYMSPNNGSKVSISRDISLSFNALEWNEQDRMFRETIRTLTGNVFNKDIDSVYIPTDFELTGDQFAAHFGKQVTVVSDEFNPKAVLLRADTTMVVDEVANMSSAQAGLSAPVTVRFTAHTNEPIASIFQWKIYKKEEGEENAFVYFSDPEVEYTFTDYGDYVASIEVSDASGTCSSYEEISVSVAESFLDVPNAFSPGTSPGVNDEFRVVYKSLVKFSCWIFNRWGQLLYHWTDPAQGWDGKKGGKYVSPGVYFYVIEAEGSDGIKYKKKGDINILRPKTIDDQINPDEGGGI